MTILTSLPRPTKSQNLKIRRGISTDWAMPRQCIPTPPPLLKIHHKPRNYIPQADGIEECQVPTHRDNKHKTAYKKQLLVTNCFSLLNVFLIFKFQRNFNRKTCLSVCSLVCLIQCQLSSNHLQIITHVTIWMNSRHCLAEGY